MNTMPVQSLLYTVFGRTCGYKTSHSDSLTEFIAKKKVKMDNNVIIKSNTSVVILSSAFSAKEREKK